MSTRGYIMNSTDIFQKSDLGRHESKNKSLGVLSQEARTLLIMINGKTPYQKYIDSLDKCNIFSDFGGIKPLFEMFLELGYIELVEQETSIFEKIRACLPVKRLSLIESI